MPGPITWPLSPLVLWGIRLSGAISAAIYQGLIQEDEEAPADLEWRRVEYQFSRPAPTGFSEDRAFIGFDVLNTSGTGPLGDWAGGDLNDLAAAFDEWWAAVRPWLTSNVAYVERRIYRRSFRTVMTPTQRFEPSGPPVHVAVPAPAQAGTASGAQYLPFQVAASVTEKTGLPRHWGRFYMPGVPGQYMDVNGRLTTAYVDALANATAELYDDLYDFNLAPIVPVTQIDGSLCKVLLGVTSVQVDSTPDVIRRRRPKSTSYRKIGAATP